MHKIDENVDVEDITKLVSIYSSFLSNYFGVNSFD